VVAKIRLKIQCYVNSPLEKIATCNSRSALVSKDAKYKPISEGGDLEALVIRFEEGQENETRESMEMIDVMKLLQKQAGCQVH